MTENIKTLFSDEEWSLLNEDGKAVCSQIAELPVSKQLDKERMREALESVSDTSK